MSLLGSSVYMYIIHPPNKKRCMSGVAVTDNTGRCPKFSCIFRVTISDVMSYKTRAVHENGVGPRSFCPMVRWVKMYAEQNNRKFHCDSVHTAHNVNFADVSVSVR